MFQRLVITRAFNRRKMYEEFLASVPLLKESMNDYERSQVASCLTTKTYLPGEIIFKQNDQANGIYFIESGCVKVFQEDDETRSIRDLGKLERGQYFGEIALINKSPRSATVLAHLDEKNKNSDKSNNQTPEYACKLAFMDIDAFERLMGPCLELLKNKIMTYKA
jgi:cAMP-dependent protein kinase regulator